MNGSRIIALAFLVAIAIGGCHSDSSASQEGALHAESGLLQDEQSRMEKNAADWEKSNARWNSEQIDKYGDGMDIDDTNPDAIERP